MFENCNILILDLIYVYKISSGDVRVRCVINKVKILKVNVKFFIMFV